MPHPPLPSPDSPLILQTHGLQGGKGALGPVTELHRVPCARLTVCQSIGNAQGDVNTILSAPFYS